MPALRIVTRIGDADDFAGTPQIGDVLAWNGSKWAPLTISAQDSRLTGIGNLDLGNYAGSLSQSGALAVLDHSQTFTERQIITAGSGPALTINQNANTNGMAINMWGVGDLGAAGIIVYSPNGPPCYGAYNAHSLNSIVYAGTHSPGGSTIMPFTSFTRLGGTPAAGYGMADDRLLSDDAGTNHTAGRRAVVWDSAGALAYASHISEYVVKGGSATLIEVSRLDAPSGAGQTGLWLYDADHGTLVRVTKGAAGSGGSGYALLCVPN